jgi:hypothetical protein
MGLKKKKARQTGGFTILSNIEKYLYSLERSRDQVIWGNIQAIGDTGR